MPTVVRGRMEQISFGCASEWLGDRHGEESENDQTRRQTFIFIPSEVGSWEIGTSKNFRRIAIRDSSSPVDVVLECKPFPIQSLFFSILISYIIMVIELYCWDVSIARSRW